MTTPIDRLDHIEQSLVRMRPTMAYEVHGAAAIRQELAALRETFAGLYRMVYAADHNGQRATEEMTRAVLNGDTCG